MGKPSLGFNLGKRVLPVLYHNVGCLMDIPSGHIIVGRRGERIINGGIGRIVSIVGSGNNYKSTLIHEFMLTAASRVYATHPTSMTLYDTELNISIDRLETFASTKEFFPPNIITNEDPLWTITDKSNCTANEWALNFSNYCTEKAKNKNNLVKYTAFTNPYTKEVLELPIPTFAEIDSLSEFEPSSSIDMLSKDLDTKDSRMYAMNQGAFKSKFISQLPRLTSASNTTLLLTAHIGEKIDMATGPERYNKPSKKLQYLPGGDYIKGGTNKFYYLVNGGSYFAHTAVKFINQNTKLPQYPIRSSENDPNELNMVRLTQLRGKNGTSGYTLNILISQHTGVCSTLTEFHNIYSNGGYGITGNNRSFSCVLRPDVTLSRTTVRSKINSDPLLARAINMCSELLQVKTYKPEYEDEGLLIPMEEIYTTLIKLGYDWDVLLNTRGWYAIDQYSPKLLPYLSSIDLLYMCAGEYIPYWLGKEETKKIKENIKKYIDPKTRKLKKA